MTVLGQRQHYRYLWCPVYLGPFMCPTPLQPAVGHTSWEGDSRGQEPVSHMQKECLGIASFIQHVYFWASLRSDLGGAPGGVLCADTSQQDAGQTDRRHTTHQTAWTSRHNGSVEARLVTSWHGHRRWGGPYLNPVVFNVRHCCNTDQHGVPTVDRLQPVIYLEPVWSLLMRVKQKKNKMSLWTHSGFNQSQPGPPAPLTVVKAELGAAMEPFSRR